MTDNMIEATRYSIPRVGTIDAEEDELDAILRQAQEEQQAREEARWRKNNLHLDIPALPANKVHHLFISHSNEPEEADWARRLVRSLEQDFGLRCIWPARDFQPGHQIGNLIQKGINDAWKTVLVMSPESNESNWCVYERDFAFHLSVNSSENQIIPVLFRECEIPDLLKTMNYIDVPAGEDPGFRIRRSFDEDVRAFKALIPMTGNRYLHNEDQPKNGKSVTINGTKNFKYICEGPSWSFRELPSNERIALRKLGSKYADKVYLAASSIANHSSMMLHYSLTNSYCYCCTVCLTLCLCLISGGIATILLYDVMKDVEVSTITGAIVFYGPMVIIPLTMLVRDKLSMRLLKGRLIKFSLKNVLKTKLLVTVTARCGSKPKLIFVYYDVKACLDQLTCLMLRRMDVMGYNEDRVRREAESCLFQLLRKNYHLIFSQWFPFPMSVVNRHPTIMHKQCLCEMAQDKLWKSHVI